MTTRTSELLSTTVAPAVTVIRGIRDDQFDLPTPCADFRVRDLLNHLYQVVVNFQALARREAADFGSTPDALHGDWRERFAAEVDNVVAAWADPAALEGVSPGMGLPQSLVGAMILLDLTVHVWDLARATGQPFDADPAVLAELQRFVAGMGEQAQQMGVFAPPVPAPAGASALDAFLASTGRDPGWTSPAS